MTMLNAQEKWQSGISYITIPEGVQREQFIYECFLTGTVSITSEAGGIINKVPVTKGCMQYINFPDQGELFGSQVVYVLDRIHNKQIVIDVLPDESENNDNEENEYVIKRKFNGSVCEIRLNPLQETISLSVTGDSPNFLITNSKGTIEIVANSKNETLNTSYEKIEMIKQTLVGNKNKYSRIVQSDEQMLIEIDKFVLGKEEEPFVQGKLLKQFLDKFIDTIANSTVATGDAGVQPLINKAQITALKKETETLLSKYFFMMKNKIKK